MLNTLTTDALTEDIDEDFNQDTTSFSILGKISDEDIQKSNMNDSYKQSASKKVTINKMNISEINQSLLLTHVNEEQWTYSKILKSDSVAKKIAINLSCFRH